METLTAISRWLAKQHVVTWCVQQEGELWCANAFYLFDAQKVAFYILTEEKTRHAQMSGPQAAVAGTVNGQPKTVALIRGAGLKVRKATSHARRTTVAFRLPECCRPRYGKSGLMKSNSPTTRWALVKK